MKSLKVIQTLSKIAWVICKVMFVICIVGASLSLVTLLTVPFIKDVVLYEDVSLTILLADKDTNVTTAIVASVVGLLGCGLGIFLAKYTELFFKKELDLGTPFDKKLVENMRKVALVHIIASIALTIVIAITLGVAKKVAGEAITMKNGSIDGSFGFGIALLVISLFCDYGAERENPNTVDVKDIDSKDKSN